MERFGPASRPGSAPDRICSGYKKPAGMGLRVFAKKSDRLRAIITDRFDRAAFLGFLALGFLVGILRLFREIGVPSIFIALEIIGRGFATQVTINALIVHVVFAGGVLWIFVCLVCHKNAQLLGEAWESIPQMQAHLNFSQGESRMLGESSRWRALSDTQRPPSEGGW
jgi:hypothetical protein